MRATGTLLVALALIAACDVRHDAESSALQPLEPRATASAASQADQDLATLRRVVAPLQDFEAAKNAGWNIKVTSCMADPKLGGMGFHYGNGALIDGAVKVDEPEALLFEPQRDGTMKFVGVEYLTPLSAWTDPKPPKLFNREFKVNQRFQVWALHVWVGKPNPSGLYSDWNPKVNCENTTDVDHMAH